MTRITTFFLGILLGAAGLYVTENFYIVRSNKSFHLIPKVSSRLEMPYRDIRHYTPQDWNANSALGLAILKSQKQDLVVDSSLDQVGNSLEDLLNSFGGDG